MAKQYLNEKAIMLMGMITACIHNVATNGLTEEDIEKEVDKIVNSALEMKLIKKPDHAVTNHHVHAMLRALFSVVRQNTI